MTGDAEQAARQVHESALVERLARLGLAARGVVWLVVGLLLVSVLRGRGDEQTDQSGALRAIADQPYGSVLLVVLIVGFAGYALWRGLSAAIGHREDDGAKRTGKRLLSAAKAGLYAALGVSALRVLTAGGSGGDQTTSTTARVMGQSGGRALVFAVGVLAIGTGIAFVVRAVLGKHLEKLETYRVPDALRTPVKVVGTVGLAGRGLVVALIGGFLVQAAVQFDPQEAKGLDAALQSLAGRAYGTALLAVAVLGMLCYAAWSFCEAAYREI